MGKRGKLQIIYDNMEDADPDVITARIVWSYLKALIKVLIYKLEGKS